MKITPELLSGVALLSVHIRESKFVDDVEQRGPAELQGAELSVEIQPGVSADKSEGVVILKIQVHPPQDAPLFKELSVSLEGRFRQTVAEPSIGLDEFLRKQAPIILMPFARDALATVTQKTRFGAILLPPLNVAAMLERIELEAAEADSTSTPS